MSLYDTQPMLPVQTVPIVKRTILQDNCTSKILDIAAIQINDISYLLKAVDEDYIIIQLLEKQAIPYEELIFTTKLSFVEMINVHKFLQEHSDTLLLINLQLDARVVLGAIYARYEIDSF